MRNRNWVFGKNGGLDFASGSPVPFSAPAINTNEGCASISTTSGVLLCFTDGTKVWDATGALRITGLAGHQSATQSSVIVPDPASGKRYYVFTADDAAGANSHLNGVRFDVVGWSSTPLASLMAMPPTAGLSGTERVIAVRHANKKDFWVLTIVQKIQASPWGILPGHLRVLKVTSAGVSYVGDQPLNRMVGDIGQMKASLNGRHLAIADMCSTRVLLFAFNNATGLLGSTSGVDIPALDPIDGTGEYPYGLEFSWSGRLLYYTTVFPLAVPSSPLADGHLFQYNIVAGTQQLVGTRQNFPPTQAQMGSLQIGSDKRIYFTQGFENKIGCIANPDFPGPGCGVTLDALALSPGSNCALGLPNMIRELF